MTLSFNSVVRRGMIFYVEFRNYFQVYCGCEYITCRLDTFQFKINVNNCGAANSQSSNTCKCVLPNSHANLHAKSQIRLDM